MGYVRSVCFAGPKCHLVACGRCAPIPAEIQTRNTAKADTQAICSERHVDQHDGQQSHSLQNRFCSLKKEMDLFWPLSRALLPLYWVVGGVCLAWVVVRNDINSSAPRLS